jgi:23S rRNA pseudouridine1911/1915/1917 synthase
MHELQIAAQMAGLRLDQALARALPQYSRARLQSWIEAGAVRVDGQLPRPRDKVLGGEQVRIEAQLAPETRVAAEKLPLDVVYKDKGLFVINKPAGLVVHPGAGNANHTLQNALLGGTVDEPIGRHRTLRVRMAVRSDGREAVTHYRVLKRFRGHSYVRAQLETGRTHQIRVHLAHIGFPLVGDPVYVGRRRIPRGATQPLIAELDAFKRQALHATRLALEHPLTGKPLEWEVPPPPDMAQLLVALAQDCK